MYYIKGNYFVLTQLHKLFRKNTFLQIFFISLNECSKKCI